MLGSRRLDPNTFYTGALRQRLGVNPTKMMCVQSPFLFCAISIYSHTHFITMSGFPVPLPADLCACFAYAHITLTCDDNFL